MTKRKWLNRILFYVVALCPLVFVLAVAGYCTGMFMAEGGRTRFWGDILWITSASVFWGGCSLGFPSGLILLLIKQKPFKTVYTLFGFLLLLFINFLINPFVLLMISLII